MAINPIAAVSVTPVSGYPAAVPARKAPPPEVTPPAAPAATAAADADGPDDGPGFDLLL